MAQLDTQEPEEDVEEEETEANGNLTKWAVVAASVLLGATVGGVMVGPNLASGSADLTGAAHGASGGGGGGGGGHGSSGAEGVLELDNLIVNPAGTEGLRFLLATVAIDLGDRHMVEELRRQNYQVRDRVTAALESQTLEMLTSPGARDSVKAIVAAAVNPLLGHGHVVEVFIPYFVIQ